MIKIDMLASGLIEKRYNLRIEHNHGDMKWYAYYGGRNGETSLFDEDWHWKTAAESPTEALLRLKQVLQ